MKASEITAFADKVIEAGCDICAIGHFGYFGSGEEMVAAEDELERINEEFGDRDFLFPEIVAYLRSIGRSIEPDPSVAHVFERLRQH